MTEYKVKTSKYYMWQKRTNSEMYLLQLSFWILRRNNVINVNYKHNKLLQFEWIYSQNIDEMETGENLDFKTLIVFNSKVIPKIYSRIRYTFLNMIFTIDMFLRPKKRKELEDFCNDINKAFEEKTK